jgi:hypothetical protein
MKRTNTRDDSESISTNVVALESELQPKKPAAITQVRRYIVPMDGYVQLSMTTNVCVYSNSKDDSVRSTPTL